MMKINKLYELAKKENIDIYNYKMINRKARIISDVNNAIFIDYSQLNNSIEEKEILAEELGHYYYDSYYTINSTKENIDRCEYRANKWKALTLCSLESILGCFNSGIYNLYDISEKLDISPKTVEFAYNYYKDNQLILDNNLH